MNPIPMTSPSGSPRVSLSAEDLAAIEQRLVDMRLPGERADDPDVVAEEAILRGVYRRRRLEELQGQ